MNSKTTKDKVAKDKVISVAYVIYNQQGEIFEYTDVPVNYVHGGKSDLFENIEKALDGKLVGEKVEVTLASDEAFGTHDPRLTFTDDIANVPEELRKVGAQLEAKNAKGDILQFIVKKIGKETLTIDGNHPLAGQTVKFEVEVKAVRDATDEEKTTGIVADLYQNL